MSTYTVYDSSTNVPCGQFNTLVDAQNAALTMANTKAATETDLSVKSSTMHYAVVNTRSRSYELSTGSGIYLNNTRELLNTLYEIKVIVPYP